MVCVTATTTVAATLLVAVAAVAAVTGQDERSNAATTPRPDLLDAVLDKCSLGPGAVDCVKRSALEWMDGGRAGRGLQRDVDLDEDLLKATSEYMERQTYGRAMDNNGGGAMEGQQQQQQQQQPMTTTTTARGLINLFNLIAFFKVVRSVFKLAQSLVGLTKSEFNIAFIPFVADMEMGMMQDKMLMPLMMMMKMKMKMLMPIMMALVSMKATKALILSKVAIFLVLGFIIKEFLKKSGGIAGLPLHLPGFPGADPSTTVGPPVMHPQYGPPQSSSGYESSSSWEPTGYSSSSGSHSSGSDSSHSMAYSSYLPSSSSSSSGSLSSSKYS